MNQTTPQVIYQPVQSSGGSGLTKLKLTEFSGDPLEWSEWSGFFLMLLFIKSQSAIQKRCNAPRLDSGVKHKHQHRECDSAHNHTIMLGIYSLRSMADQMS